jgi:hypothetical protein
MDKSHTNNKVGDVHTDGWMDGCCCNQFDMDGLPHSNHHTIHPPSLPSFVLYLLTGQGPVPGPVAGGLPLPGLHVVEQCDAGPVAAQYRGCLGHELIGLI